MLLKTRLLNYSLHHDHHLELCTQCIPPLLFAVFFVVFLMGPRYFLVMVLLLRRTWNWWVAWSNQVGMAWCPSKNSSKWTPTPMLKVQTTLLPGWHMPTQTHPQGPNLPSKQGKIFAQHHTALQVKLLTEMQTDLTTVKFQPSTSFMFCVTELWPSSLTQDK